MIQIVEVTCPFVCVCVCPKAKHKNSNSRPVFYTCLLFVCIYQALDPEILKLKFSELLNNADIRIVKQSAFCCCCCFVF